MIETATPPSLEQLIESAVRDSENPTKRDVTRSLLSELNEDQLRWLAEEALGRKVAALLRTPREGSRGPTVEGTPVPRSTRWEMVAATQATGELDLARLQVETGEETKPLLECRYADLKDAAHNHLRFALANKAYSDSYSKLAEALLNDDDARTVADLPESYVKGILRA
ncbi:MAG TPA: hypothetical protein VMS11_04780 [Solirubrobacterales bacterium]|nr:hypothetical protein [Solirubrobacterales bacterium]